MSFLKVGGRELSPQRYVGAKGWSLKKQSLDDLADEDKNALLAFFTEVIPADYKAFAMEREVLAAALRHLGEGIATEVNLVYDELKKQVGFPLEHLVLNDHKVFLRIKKGTYSLPLTAQAHASNKNVLDALAQFLSYLPRYELGLVSAQQALNEVSQQVSSVISTFENLQNSLNQTRNQKETHEAYLPRDDPTGYHREKVRELSRLIDEHQIHNSALEAQVGRLRENEQQARATLENLRQLLSPVTVSRDGDLVSRLQTACRILEEYGFQPYPLAALDQLVRPQLPVVYHKDGMGKRLSFKTKLAVGGLSLFLLAAGVAAGSSHYSNGRQAPVSSQTIAELERYLESGTLYNSPSVDVTGYERSMEVAKTSEGTFSFKSGIVDFNNRQARTMVLLSSQGSQSPSYLIVNNTAESDMARAAGFSPLLPTMFYLLDGRQLKEALPSDKVYCSSLSENPAFLFTGTSVYKLGCKRLLVVKEPPQNSQVNAAIEAKRVQVNRAQSDAGSEVPNHLEIHDSGDAIAQYFGFNDSLEIGSYQLKLDGAKSHHLFEQDSLGNMFASQITFYQIVFDQEVFDIPIPLNK